MGKKVLLELVHIKITKTLENKHGPVIQAAHGGKSKTELHQNWQSKKLLMLLVKLSAAGSECYVFKNCTDFNTIQCNFAGVLHCLRCCILHLTLNQSSICLHTLLNTLEPMVLFEKNSTRLPNA